MPIPTIKIEKWMFGSIVLREPPHSETPTVPALQSPRYSRRNVPTFCHNFIVPS